MPEGSATEKPSPASLIPMVFVALGVLALALAVSGVLWRTTTGTIVVQTETLRSASIVNGRSHASRSVSLTTITETSANGNEQRELTMDSVEPAGYQELSAGNTLQLYDPATNSIYVTTQAAWQRAVVEQMKRSAPTGSNVSVRQMTSRAYSYGATDFPGHTSIFEQRWRAGFYRLDGRAMIAGRTALRLVPARSPKVSLGPNSGAFQLLGTVYVSPVTYDPIRQVIRTSFGSFNSSLQINWTVYKVLPDNRANHWLVSLRARHPHARLISGAAAYLAAQTREGRLAEKATTSSG